VASYDVDLVEFTFAMSDGVHLDDLGVSMSHKEFYDLMRKGEEPKTSLVPYHIYEDRFERAAASGVPTVYLGFTAALSGSLDVARQAAADVLSRHPNAELYVVDTKLPSAAEGLLVMEAMRQLDRGLSAREVVAWAEEARYYVNGFFTLLNLDALQKGGRIPDMAAVVGAKLDIKPILTYDIDGRLTFYGVARGRKKALKQLLQIYLERRGDDYLDTVIVASADANKEQNAFVEQVLKFSGANLSVWQTQIGPVIGSHVGPGMMAIVFWGPDRRKRVSLTDRIANAVSHRNDQKDEGSSYDI
jgi:DegV family protein with EDD domain